MAISSTQNRPSSCASEADELRNNLWTTLYLGHAVTAHRNEGHHIEEHHLAHISPARFKHINPYGTYTFNVQDILQQCRHRPLNPLPTHWPCAETWVGWGEILGMGLRPRWNR